MVSYLFMNLVSFMSFRCKSFVTIWALHDLAVAKTIESAMPKLVDWLISAASSESLAVSSIIFVRVICA